MKKILHTLLALLFLPPMSMQAAPDLAELLKGAAQAAQNRQGSSQSSNENSNNADGNTGASTQQQSSNSTSGSAGGSQSGVGGLLQGLGGLLGGGSSDGGNSGGSSLPSGLSGLLNGLLSTEKITVKDLTGTWKYSQPAVAFQSDNFLQKAGGAAAAGMINEKIAPYYQKVGMDKLEITFNADATFVFKMPRVSIPGSIESATDNPKGNFIFTFKALGKIPIGNMPAQVEKQINSITITFDVSKLITLVDTIAQLTGQSTLQTVSKLLKSYDGLNCGFELTRVK
ncbi:MAG: DUF4923 family protein [Muribaculaceae bacterium]|nr:DUF4923 family protein [Muribaculaceae bacterium]